MPYSIKNTSKPLKMESPLFIHWNTLELILLVRFHISYIKRGVTYFIINSFVDIISKAKMKYLHDVGKLSSKITTMFFSRTNTSKNVS